MPQRKLGGGTVNPEERTPHDGRKCGEATLAALSAIAEYCGEDRAPLRVDDSLMAMAPPEAAENLPDADPEDLSDREIQDLIEDDDWLAEFTERVCSEAGLDPDSRAHRACQVNYARRVLE